MNDLIPVFRDSLFDSCLISVASEIAESGIDSVLVNGVLKEIPIVNLVIGIGQTAFKIRDYIFLKHTLHFISYLHDGSITSRQFQEYKKELEEDPKKAEKELSRVITLLDRIIDDEKTKILASFFRAYIKNSISWSKFCELSDALDRLFVTDVHLLYQVKELENRLLYEEGGYAVDRLVSVGVIRNPTSNVLIHGGGLPPFGKIPLTLTDLGRTFVQLYVFEATAN